MTRRTRLEPHLPPDELRQRYLKTEDLSERRHFHVLWLISQGETQARTAHVVGISDRWVQEIVKRYNAGGAEAMRDRRHDHPGAARTLNAEGERALEAVLQSRPACSVTGWRTLHRLGQTPQRPRPRDKRADPQAQEAFQEASAAAQGRSTGAVPGRGGGDLGDG